MGRRRESRSGIEEECVERSVDGHGGQKETTSPRGGMAEDTSGGKFC